MTATPLLAMPPDSARLLLSEGGVRCAPFLNMSDFAKHATDCGMPINAERLLGFERRGLFSPVFRLREPDEEGHALRLPLEGTVWFDKGWAIDISAGQRHPTPKRQTQSSEAFYSRFQIASLEFVLSQYELAVQTEDFLLAPAFDAEKWTAIGRRLYEHGAAYAQDRKRETKRFRPAVVLLCQFISDRYYPRTRSNMRVRYSGGMSSFSDWISVDSHEWRWETYVQQWDPKRVEEVFALTPSILRHAYEALAHQQSWLDPMENWYDLMQFVSVERREKLTGKARGRRFYAAAR